MALFAAAFVGGCGSDEGLFASKPAPDEFAVPQRAPLALPPDFSIRPPTPGAKRPQGIDPRRQVEASLRRSGGDSGKASSGGGDSPGLNALLKETGGLDADPKIRDDIRREMSDFTQGNSTFTDRLLGWTTGKKPTKKGGVIIDAESEAKRIKATQAEGLPVSSGASPPPPKITRGEGPKKKGFWSSLF